MKKIIRLTESELNTLIGNSVKRILREEVLGDNWNVNDIEDEGKNNQVLNNYEAGEYFKDEANNDNHDQSVVGNDPYDPTEYGNDSVNDNVDLGDGNLYYNQDF